MKTAGTTISILLITGVIIFALPVRAQVYTTGADPDDPTGTIESTLNSLIKSQIGQEFTATFSVLDSSIRRNETTTDGGELTDPYGTLKGFVLFGADKGDMGDWDHGIMGLYKDGQIVWYSDPVFRGTWQGIFAIKDINVDGKAEILVEWSPYPQLSVRYLWIISWDGHSGSIINEVDGENGNSAIISEYEMFQLIEPESEKPYVIRGYWSTSAEDSSFFPSTQIATKPWVTYSWNGALYGLWPSTRQIPGNEFLPANRLSVAVSCTVNTLQDSLAFRYSWSNSKDSQQRMSAFSLAGVERSFSTSGLNGWFFWGWWQDAPIAGWEVRGLNRFDLSLPPGRNQTGVSIHATGIPGVVKFYIQGYRPNPDFGVNSANYTSAFKEDFYGNSFVGATVGPIDPPDPFMPGDFIDTLMSYKHRSVALGWLSNDKSRERECEHTLRSRGWYKKWEVGKLRKWEVDDSWDFDKNWNNGIVGVLDKRLEKAKRALVRGDSVKARRELQIFVMEAELVYSLGEKTDARGKKQDVRNKKLKVRGRKPVMTSEAYALLKYNAEYLIDRLPAKHGRGR